MTLIGMDLNIQILVFETPAPLVTSTSQPVQSFFRAAKEHIFCTDPAVKRTLHVEASFTLNNVLYNLRSEGRTSKSSSLHDFIT